jgi:7,8-dihydroneopterin aldolase/epimerase/oxygenase
LEKAMDKIFLEGIQLGIRVGTTAEERDKPQPCRLDIVLKADLSQAGQSGDLDKTIDYVAVFRCAEKICSNNSFTLLEEIAHQICRAILERFAVKEVELRIRKAQPFSEKLSAVGVQLKRNRRDLKK